MSSLDGSLERPRKEELCIKIEQAAIKGDITQSDVFGIDYIHDCLPRNGTFNNKTYYSARIIINVYTANILRQLERVIIIRRDVQLYYAENKKECYQCCINPAPDECFDSDEYEIVLAARSDGKGNFLYFLYDLDFFAEYKKLRPRNRSIRRKEDIHGVLKLLQQFKVIYRLRLLDNVMGSLCGIPKSEKQVEVDLSVYADYVMLDIERTRRDGKGSVEFFIPKTPQYYADEQDLCILNEHVERLEKALQRNYKKRLQLLERLGEVDNQLGEIEYFI